jgi:hypothetical protein
MKYSPLNLRGRTFYPNQDEYIIPRTIKAIRTFENVLMLPPPAAQNEHATH